MNFLVSFPEGYSCIFIDHVGSTNTELCRHISSGFVGCGVWVCADEQLEGRGRLGRAWHSGLGNLHASVSVCLGSGSTHCYELSFVAGLSVYDCICRILSDHGYLGSYDLFLKWPNDVLLDGLKFSGILLEYSGFDDIYVIGFGINLVFSPSLEGVTNLLSHFDIRFDRDFVLSHLAWSFWHRLAIWREKGFDVICADWLSHSHNIGDNISVFLDKDWVSGIFRGIDDCGFLLFEDGSGFIHRIVSGDVGFFRSVQTKE